MASLGNFDATQVKPAEAFSVIPPGRYKVQIVDSDIRASKNGNGSYVWLELEILEGEFQGRKLWDRITNKNSNPEAEGIGQRQLSALCHACGKLRPSDTEELHFIPIIATVRVKPSRTDPNTGTTYDSSNEVRGYSPLEETTSRPAAPSARPGATAASSAAVPPWKQRKAS